MPGCLIKERNVLENEFAIPDPFIDRWSATAQPASFNIKMEEGDKGSVWCTGRDWYAHRGVQGSHPVIQLILTWTLVIATVTRSDCTLDRREIAVKGTCPANRSRKEHPQRSGVAQKGFLFVTIILSPKDEDLHVNERSMEQISSVIDQYERSERWIMAGKLWMQNVGEAFHGHSQDTFLQ